MIWTHDPDHPFAGIIEKLKRANESIGTLQSEVASFVEGGCSPVLPETESAELQKAVDYHRGRTIPKRFSVLSGEIIHQLRSCLDHVAWHFSGEHYRIDSGNAIEFPVFREEPLSRDEIRRYERKVKEITDPKALSFIRAMQPYNRTNDPENDPICIVHDMDRFDKHRELAVVVSCASVSVPTSAGSDIAFAMMKHSRGEILNDAELALVHRTLKENAKVSPQIAFA
jgi:hypothetical protein